MESYARPEVIDYGTLVELTEADKLANADTPAGTADTAYPIAS